VNSGPRIRVNTVALNANAIAVLGGLTLTGAGTGDPAMYFDTPPSATYSPQVVVDPTVSGWTTVAAMLTLGSGVFVVHPLDGRSWLVDTAGSHPGATLAIVPPMGRVSAYAAYTGRSVVVWGGHAEGAMGLTALGDGAIGVVSPTGVAMWLPLPSVGAPAAQWAHDLGSFNPQGAQRAWTGRELIVFGGYGSGGAVANAGARYQPPVGCVCPRNAGAPAWIADGCVGVSPDPAPPYDGCSP
jgi:hypothetical protein